MKPDWQAVVTNISGNNQQIMAANILGYEDALSVPIDKKVEWLELSKQL